MFLFVAKDKGLLFLHEFDLGGFNLEDANQGSDCKQNRSGTNCYQEKTTHLRDVI